MKQHWIPLSALALLLTDITTAGEGSSITTESLVDKSGYPYEKHQCRTSDGYILAIHRIPYSARVNASSPRPTAFLMHGLLGSSSDWVFQGPGRSLAYLLSDAGYDVWLGNARGNRYSRKHIVRSPESRSFWNFTWHEIGMIDLPTMINYIRWHTGVDQVRYFGHSQGTTSFLVLTSLNLDIKSRIKSAHLLAPVAFMNHLKSPLLRDIAPLLGNPNPLVEITGSVEFMPNTKAQEDLANKACADGSPIQFLCSIGLFTISGFDSANLNTTGLPLYMAINPAGASINQGYHYLQEINSGHFRQFDYGNWRNKLTYGSEEPPNYPLEKIDVPIFLYYGKNDFLAAVVDVQRLIRRLMNSTLQRAYLVPYPKWTHLDFLLGINAKREVYDVIFEDMASIE